MGEREERREDGREERREGRVRKERLRESEGGGGRGSRKV